MNNPIFEIGQTVYHVVDEMQEPHLITGIVQRSNNVFTYLISTKLGENEAYSIELSSEKIIF